MDAYVITFGSGRLLRYLAIGASAERGATWTRDLALAEKFFTEERAKTAARTHVPNSVWSVSSLAKFDREPSVA